MLRRPFALVALALLAPLAVAQTTSEDPDQDPDMMAPQGYVRVPKAQEKAKYHATMVRGMSPADRDKGYRRRLELKAASPFSAIKWRNVGPTRQGGRVVDIAAPARDPDSLYVAYATGGLFRTQDEGDHWESLFDDQSAFGIGAIAASADGKTLWVGSGEANSQRTSYAGTGVFKSTDAGKTWENMGLADSHHIGKVLIDPRHEDTVYVAALGHLYSENGERGVYKTVDGGHNWTQVLKGDPWTGAVDLAFEPGHPDIVYASMWERDRRPWNFLESGSGSAVYRSENGGKTWTKMMALPKGDDAGRVGLATTPAAPNRVYAFFDNQGLDPDYEFRDERIPGGRLTVRRFLLLNDATAKDVDEKAWNDFLRAYSKVKTSGKEIREGKLSYTELKKRIVEEYPEFNTPNEVGSELWRSDDRGRTWNRESRQGSIGGYYWGKVFANPYDKEEVFVTGFPLLRSRDGGVKWESIAERAHVDHHAIWTDPRNPKKVWLGNDGGLYESLDGGTTVRAVNNLPVAQSTTLAVDDQKPYRILVGNQDNGTMRGPSNHDPAEDDDREWVDIFGGDGSAVAVDPRDGGARAYVAFQFGQHFAEDPSVPGGFRSVTPKDEGLRFNWISPILVSRWNPDILYIGSQYLHRSFNGGRTWEKISPDLTKNRPQGDVPFSTLKDVSESPLRFGLIYTGADDGTVQMTPDGGFQWTNVSTPSPDKWVSRVIASRYDVATVYVAQNGYREDDFAPYLWKSADYGKSWTSIAAGLPNEPVNVVREDPKDKDILYVGTDMGVYQTLDGGKTWEALAGGMPNMPVHDLAVQEREDDLVAATHARGAYVISLKTIRKATPEVRVKDLAILELADVKRDANWGYDRRQVYDSTPPKEPTTSGLLWAKEPGKADFRVLDKDGKPVKIFSKELARGLNPFEIGLEITPGKAGTVDERGRKVTTAQEALSDPHLSERTVYLSPGEYTVEVYVNGRTETRKFKVNE
ncbi:hypothetical protein BH11ARM2_BH11ARM2_26000 [soil metagenome]